MRNIKDSKKEKLGSAIIRHHREAEAIGYSWRALQNILDNITVEDMQNGNAHAIATRVYRQAEINAGYAKAQHTKDDYDGVANEAYSIIKMVEDQKGMI